MLKKELKETFGDIELGDQEAIKTAICVITKRADTGSTWPIINNPKSKYYKYNKEMPLRDVIRASTAAPVFFMPQQLNIGRDVNGAFVDGGVSMSNNPALQLFLLSTLKGYAFNWEKGQDNILLVSIGTGSWDLRTEAEEVLEETNIAEWGMAIPTMLMSDANWWNQLILQMISDSPTAIEIDREVGDLNKDLLSNEPALSYLRYEVFLEEDKLKKLGVDDALSKRAVELQDMTNGKNRFDLEKIGALAADKQITPEHFPAVFDL